MKTKALAPLLAAAFTVTACSGESDAPPSETPTVSDVENPVRYTSAELAEWEDEYLAQLEEAIGSAGASIEASGADADSAESAMPSLELDELQQEFVAFVHPDDFVVKQAECLQSFGFDVVADAELSFVELETELPASSRVEFDVAGVRCKARFPMDPRVSQPLSDEQHRIVYDYLVDELVPCLEGRGYNPETPPTFETYLSAAQQQRATWSPYDAVGELGQGEWDQLNRECPQNPSTEAVWGELE